MASDTSARPFLSVLGHELRNQLAPLQNAAYLLRLRARDDGTLGNLAGIMERQLAAIVRTLDVVAEADRIERGDTAIERRAVPLRSLVEQAISRLRPELERRTRGVGLAIPDDLPPVRVDETRIVRVLVMLLDHALRQGYESGRITIGARQDGHDVLATIEHEGTAPDPAASEQLFAFPVAGAHSAEGLGLALPVARAVARLHDGDLRVAPGPAAGTTVVELRLPWRGSPGEARPHGDAGGFQLAPVAPRAGSARRVLIVDDNAAVRASLSDLLETMGFEVCAVADGTEAIRVARSWKPRSILLDIHMPGPSGFDTARALRAELPPPLTLVMMSGERLDQGLRGAARAAGFDHCVDKGLGIDELAQVLDAS